MAPSINSDSFRHKLSISRLLSHAALKYSRYAASQRLGVFLRVFFLKRNDPTTPYLIHFFRQQPPKTLLRCRNGQRMTTRVEGFTAGQTNDLRMKWARLSGRREKEPGWMRQMTSIHSQYFQPPSCLERVLVWWLSRFARPERETEKEDQGAC